MKIWIVFVVSNRNCITYGNYCDYTVKFNNSSSERCLNEEFFKSFCCKVLDKNKANLSSAILKHSTQTKIQLPIKLFRQINKTSATGSKSPTAAKKSHLILLIATVPTKQQTSYQKCFEILFLVNSSKLRKKPISTQWRCFGENSC